MGPHYRLAFLLSLSCLASGNALAGQAHVLKAEIQRQDDGRYRIETTVRHTDTGWDHYANRWEVLGPQGQVIATRMLSHPHIHEQPFTRALLNITIPPTWTWLRIRAHDKVHGYGGREVTVSIPPRTRH